MKQYCWYTQDVLFVDLKQYCWYTQDVLFVDLKQYCWYTQDVLFELNTIKPIHWTTTWKVGVDLNKKVQITTAYVINYIYTGLSLPHFYACPNQDLDFQTIRLRVMMFNATFNNISVTGISWWWIMSWSYLCSMIWGEMWVCCFC